MPIEEKDPNQAQQQEQPPVETPADASKGNAQDPTPNISQEQPADDKAQGQQQEEAQPKEGEEEKPQENQPEDQNQQEDAPGNGIPIEQVVLKDELDVRLAALESKLDALIKENSDLKDKLAESDKANKQLKDKYENSNFGGYGKGNNIAGKNKVANESFDEYSKQFM